MADNEWTGTEIAAIIGWRYVRNRQRTWRTPDIVAEFGITREGVRGIFSRLEPVIGIEDKMAVCQCGDEEKWQPVHEYNLTGDPIPANGNPLSSQAGAFVIACHLARQRWAENSALAKLARWDTHRTAQVVFYKMRLLPIVRYSRRGPGAETLWVVMN